jgi:hypothetical protein
MKKLSGRIIYSPSDLVRYAQSPFSSWMDRYYLENRDAVTPDQETDDQKLIARTGDQHEHAVLEEFKLSVASLVEIVKDDATAAHLETIAAIQAHAPIIYQALALPTSSSSMRRDDIRYGIRSLPSLSIPRSSSGRTVASSQASRGASDQG